MRCLFSELWDVFLGSMLCVFAGLGLILMFAVAVAIPVPVAFIVAILSGIFWSWCYFVGMGCVS